MMNAFCFATLYTLESFTRLGDLRRDCKLTLIVVHFKAEFGPFTF